MHRNRIVNIRITTVAFLGLILGIIFSYLYLNFKISLSVIFLFSLVLIIITIATILYSKFTSNFNKTCEFRKNISSLIKASALVFFITFFVGLLLFLKPYFMLCSIKDYDDTVNVRGVICDYVKDDNTHKKFLIKNCIINDNGDEDKINFKVCVYAPKFLNVKLGDVVSFESNLKKMNVDKKSGFNKLIHNIGYNAFIDFDNFDVSDNNASLKDLVKNSTFEILSDNLNEENSNIFYAILFGDKQGLSEQTQEMFSYAGISHILAVSGLHVGVLVGIIYFILKKIRVNKYLRLVMLSVILLFYAYLCSFTASVSRACLMSILMCLCDTFCFDYDSLSSLSIAGFIILFLNPLYLFTISFQLSFICVFSIISLAPSIFNFFKIIKLPKFLSMPLAISCATNLAILPICFNAFTKVSLVGVLTNVFVLPLFGISYVLLFVLLIPALIFNSLGSLLVIPELFMHLIKSIANISTYIPSMVFKVFNISYFSLFALVLLLFFIHYVMYKSKLKFAISLIMVSIIATMFFVSNIPYSYNGDNLVFGLKYKSNLCYFIDDNQVTLIGSNIKYEVLQNELKKLKIKKIENIIAYDFQLNSCDDLKEFCTEYEVKNLYLPNKFNYKELNSSINGLVFFDNNLSIGKLKLSTILFDEKIIGIYLNFDDKCDILIPEVKPNKKESAYISQNYRNIDYIYINNENVNLDLELINPNKIIMNENSSIADIELERNEKYIMRL